MSKVRYGDAFSLLCQEHKESWQDFVSHEFVRQISSGTLPRENFLYYLKQDYVFLVHFSRAWALAVVKAETLEEMRIATSTVDTLVNYEMQLHISACEKEGISRSELFETVEASQNLAYTRYVLEAGYSGNFLDLIISLVPCVLGYGEIGLRLVSNSESSEYGDWINTYGSKDYQSACFKVGNILDEALVARLGKNYMLLPVWKHLSERFSTATKLEIGFWEMGLKLP